MGELPEDIGSISKNCKSTICHTKKFNLFVRARSRQWQNSTYILIKGVKVVFKEEQGGLSNTEDFI